MDLQYLIKMLAFPGFFWNANCSSNKMLDSPETETCISLPVQFLTLGPRRWPPGLLGENLTHVVVHKHPNQTKMLVYNGETRHLETSSFMDIARHTNLSEVGSCFRSSVCGWIQQLVWQVRRATHSSQLEIDPKNTLVELTMMGFTAIAKNIERCAGYQRWVQIWLLFGRIWHVAVAHHRVGAIATSSNGHQITLLDTGCSTSCSCELD